MSNRRDLRCRKVPRTKTPVLLRPAVTWSGQPSADQALGLPAKPSTYRANYLCWSSQECAGVIRSVLECAEDFQSFSPRRVSVRNCLTWNKRRPTASCAGVYWNDQECAGVGHNLGTTSAANMNALRRRGRPVRGPHQYGVTCHTQTLAAPGADGTA